MRNIVWILVAVVVVGGAYLLFTGQTPREVATEASEAISPPATEEVAEEPAVETTDEAVQDAAEGAQSIAEEAAEAAEEAADAVADTASEGAAAVQDAAETATTETATTGTATTTAAADDAQELLTVDGFDFERVSDLIENSDIEPPQKTTLRTELEQARDDPELLQETLDRIREALDL